MPSKTIFGHVFWAFGPAIEGFKYCGPLIQIDGTHFYGKYKGKLLTALSIDSNGHIFPLSFAIGEGKIHLVGHGFCGHCASMLLTEKGFA